jgi:cation diffusion facilitator family transporter
LIGMVLTAGGVLISFSSIQKLGRPREVVASFVIYPLLVSLLAKGCLAVYKFHYGKRLKSDALRADAWNDMMDSVSATVALIAVGLALLDANRFAESDRYGGALVGVLVIATGLRIAYDTAMQLIDTMPGDDLMAQLREAARAEPGVRGVEKCFARKTGLKYHVDLHLEVDPEMTVRQSHDIAHQVRLRIMHKLDWVADVLVHVEPAP